jgi:hypothetical protein
VCVWRTWLKNSSFPFSYTYNTDSWSSLFLMVNSSSRSYEIHLILLPFHFSLSQVPWFVYRSVWLNYDWKKSALFVSLHLSDLWLYSPLLDLGRFFSFLIYTQSVGFLGRGCSPSQGRCLHTEQHKHKINAPRHPCLEWDSNPRSQCLSGRIRFYLRPRGHYDRRNPTSVGVNHFLLFNYFYLACYWLQLIA